MCSTPLDNAQENGVLGLTNTGKKTQLRVTTSATDKHESEAQFNRGKADKHLLDPRCLIFGKEEHIAFQANTRLASHIER